MKLLPMIFPVLLAMMVTACVTINIYFPAAAAEKAADKIIDEVWQLKKPEQPATPPSSNAPQPK